MRMNSGTATRGNETMLENADTVSKAKLSLPPSRNRQR